MIVKVGVKKFGQDWYYRTVHSDAEEFGTLIKNFLLNGGIHQISLKRLPAEEVDILGDATTGNNSEQDQ